MKTVNFKRYCTFILCSAPILSRYASPIPQATLTEFFILIALPWLIIIRLKKGQSICVWKEAGTFLLWCLIEILFALIGLKGEMLTDAVGSTLRLVIVYIAIYIIIPNEVDPYFSRKTVRFWSLVLSIYGLAQVVAVRFGIVLTTYLPFLSPFGGEKTTDIIMYDQVHRYNLVFRCRSLMSEPAMLCTYLVIGIFLELFINIKDTRFKRSRCYSVLYTITAFISRSSTGIMLCMAVWVIYYIYSTGKATRKTLYQNLVIGGAVAAIGIVVVTVSGIWEYFINRTFQGTISVDGLMNSTRFRDLAAIFKNSDTIQGVLFGGGLVDIEQYLPGFPRLYYAFGLVGLGIAVLMLLKIYKYGNKITKLLTVVYSVLNIGTEIIIGPFAMVYMVFLSKTLNCEYQKGVTKDEPTKGLVYNTRIQHRTTNSRVFKKRTQSIIP